MHMHQIRAQFSLVVSMALATGAVCVGATSPNHVENSTGFWTFHHSVNLGDGSTIDTLSDDQADIGSGYYTSFSDLTLTANSGGTGTLSLTLRAPEGMAFSITPTGWTSSNDSRLSVFAGFGPFLGAYANATLSDFRFDFTNLSGGGIGAFFDTSYLYPNGDYAQIGFQTQITEAMSFSSLTYSFDYAGATFTEDTVLPWLSWMAGSGSSMSYYELHGPLTSDPGPAIKLIPIPEPASFSNWLAVGALIVATSRRSRQPRG